MSRRPPILLGILLCLIITVAVCLYAESLHVQKNDHTTEKSFQHIVHSIGLGATAKPTWCYINFDPRVDPRCPCIEWPIPGGFCYCPDHTGTVSYIAGNVEMGVAIEIMKNQKGNYGVGAGQGFSLAGSNENIP